MSKDKDCFIFKDLYEAYIEEEVEEETSKWMENHLLNCSKCKDWSEEFNKKTDHGCGEEAVNEKYNMKEEDIEMKVLKRARILLMSALVIAVALGIWMSLWLFI
jgi:predicted anti-sigma-YlaC factor YlaD